MLRLFRLALFTLVAAFILLAAGTYFLVQRFEAPGPAISDVRVLIPLGTGVGGIARMLGEAGVVKDPQIFDLGVRIFGRGRVLKAGEYIFAARTSARQAVELMIAGRTVVHRLTVPEGLTTAEILALVAGAEGLQGDLPSAPEAPEEGTLLPETYFYSWGDTRASTLARMQAEMRRTVDELWSARLAALPFAAPRDAVTLASIVEKETAVAAERPRIAGVLLNRLKKGMPLQSDPTVVYALTRGNGPLDRPLTRVDLATVSPYNTYLNIGLPPGPIANPGRESLLAVMQPLQTKELYFVADGSGGHAFAETLGEHKRNVAKWRQIEATQGSAPAPASQPAAAAP